MHARISFIIPLAVVVLLLTLPARATAIPRSDPSTVALDWNSAAVDTARAARGSVAAHVSGGAANGDWIVYSTAPGDDQIHRPGYPGGSDAFLVRPGGIPRLVAGRGN